MLDQDPPIRATWKDALCVFWAQTWRFCLLAGIVGSALQYLLRPWPIASLNAYILLVVVTQIWAVRKSLNIQYRRFTISLIRNVTARP
jgi:hypothetical protein